VLGALTFYVLLLATTLVYVVVLAIYVPGHLASLDLGLIAATTSAWCSSSRATAIGFLLRA